MAPRQKNPPSRKSDPKPLINGEVVEVLGTLPENQPFSVLQESEK